MAIKNLKKHMILALKKISISVFFWAIYRQQEKKLQVEIKQLTGVQQLHIRIRNRIVHAPASVWDILAAASSQLCSQLTSWVSKSQQLRNSHDHPRKWDSTPAWQHLMRPRLVLLLLLLGRLARPSSFRLVPTTWHSLPLAFLDVSSFLAHFSFQPPTSRGVHNSFFTYKGFSLTPCDPPR